GLVGHGFLIAINQVRKRQRSQLIALVVLALLTLVLGRWWGPQGVAIALFVADAILIAQYYGILSKMNLHIRTWFFVPVCVAGASMAVTTVVVTGTFVLDQWVIGRLVVYALALLHLSGSRVFDVIRVLRHWVSGLA